ncbi:DUF1015 domain-containing protein [Nonomuraea sp. PA05]|uniref:DUF1015 domain-containing protein n=1 Tax=Nonomuraea sp. PA05 TaxID=2604466 RepID=UPI0021CCF61F|nr:DUF1015 domain-containing protein [Nonomuraea sp. PA05]
MGTPELPVPAGLVLRPFRGVRFAVEDPAKVTSPPYDLISDADVEVLLDAHPNNVVRLILPCSSPSNSSPPTTEIHPASQAATGPSDARDTRDIRDTDATPPTTTDEAHSASPTVAAPVTHSASQITTPETDPASPLPLQPRYAVARDTLKEWLDSGVLVPDDVPALYVYEQTGPDILQRGLIGDVGLADPGQRIILPHEDVFPGPIADRLALMSTTQANLEPIFLLYDGDDGTATHLVDEVASTRHPLVSAQTEDGLTHRLWAITAPEEIAAINADLQARQALIADGHHRYATYRVLQRQERATHHDLHKYVASALGPWDFGLALLVDSRAYPPDLKAIHRVIQGLPLDEAVSRAKTSWQVHDYKDLSAGLAALERASEPAFLLAGEDGSHLLTDPDPVQFARAMPPDRSDRWNSLNTSVLSEFVLPVVWGMRDNDQTVRIVHHDTDAAVQLAIRTGGTAVLLKPLAIDDVLAVAAGGERVPRKSTSFGPKPRTGLVLRTFATG